jgi:AcrR family transcriptional regulator
MAAALQSPALERVPITGSEAYVAFRAMPAAQVPEPASPAGAFAAARRTYLAGERISMQALAAELGVSRPTLYRWTGDRERQLSDVLFSLSDESFSRALARSAHLSGPARLLAVFRGHVGSLVRAAPLQSFLQQETQAALRILTARDSSVQMRTVERLAELYREEERAGAFAPPVDIDTLAYAVVKVTEAFIYNDAILAVEPQMERAAEIVGLMLGGVRSDGPPRGEAWRC